MAISLQHSLIQHVHMGQQKCSVCLLRIKPISKFSAAASKPLRSMCNWALFSKAALFHCLSVRQVAYSIFRVQLFADPTWSDAFNFWLGSRMHTCHMANVSIPMFMGSIYAFWACTVIIFHCLVLKSNVPDQLKVRHDQSIHKSAAQYSVVIVMVCSTQVFCKWRLGYLPGNEKLLELWIHKCMAMGVDQKRRLLLLQYILLPDPGGTRASRKPCHAGLRLAICIRLDLWSGIHQIFKSIWSTFSW